MRKCIGMLVKLVGTNCIGSCNKLQELKTLVTIIVCCHQHHIVPTTSLLPPNTDHVQASAVQQRWPDDDDAATVPFIWYSLNGLARLRPNSPTSPINIAGGLTKMSGNCLWMTYRMLPPPTTIYSRSIIGDVKTINQSFGALLAIAPPPCLPSPSADLRWLL